MEQNTPETESELDMAKAERVGHEIPSQEHMEDRLEYFEDLDDQTLIDAWHRGFQEGDMYSVMDSAAISTILVHDRGYHTEPGKVLKDGQVVSER